MKLVFTVPPCADGILLRDFLRDCKISGDLTRSVKFNGGGYFANGEPIIVTRRVKAGWEISFNIPPEKSEGALPEKDIPLDVVWEDTFAMVVNKPFGIAMHPTFSFKSGTLANAYAYHCLQKGESPVFRSVNRLDKDTSGLVLLAKNSYATPLLAKNVQKKYLAVPQGELPLGKNVINAPIARDENSIIGRCVAPNGKESITEYEIIKSDGKHSFALCTPVTGRTHQIRVHFSHIGHPLAGDDLYGGSLEHLKRQALHCQTMEFLTPKGEMKNGDFYFDKDFSMQKIKVESEIPVEFLKLFD